MGGDSFQFGFALLNTLDLSILGSFPMIHEAKFSFNGFIGK